MNFLELYIDGDDLNKIRDCDDLYLKSVALVRVLFCDRKDPQGNPCLEHLLRVSNKMETLDGIVAGLLHEVVEFIPNVTFEDLLDIGIPNNIVDILRIVTLDSTTRKLSPKEKLDRYNQHIDSIISSNNHLALELKLADISDIYCSDRLEKLSIQELVYYNEKYAKNLVKLKEEKEKRKILC